ncbi:hypothetical protein SCP_0408890 [Sparassis crispa]|uniref:F-box domain-containing protein n=1 Tax=Sparassis crispa TaxID=139825 RepID=A0A401GK13_9APHY|nr:hypothetical protein SCP_0408890 [Sparassis crispa]GBE82505.1 hypothetical protein SCP_0408890 [Sparassis crispa]
MNRKRVRINYAQFDVSDDDDDDDDEEAAPVVAKPAARAFKLRGKKGGLKDMPNMPIDIVFEICILLQPQDLLNLTRTSKDFRAVLLKRSTAFIWKTTRKQIDGLPDCPPFMSEPAYANLCFSTHCHSCLKIGVSGILWEFGARYCSKCKNECTTDHLPDSIHGRAYRTLLNYIPRYRRAPLFHRPQVTELAAALENLEEDSAQEKTFLSNQSARVKEIQDHASLCNKYTEEQAKSRAEVRDDVRTTRLKAIIAKLRELGYGEDLEAIRGISYRPLTENSHVRVPAKLTERAWQIMKGDVIAIMDTVKNERLRQQRRKSTRLRLECIQKMANKHTMTFPRSAKSQCVPRFVDFANMPEFQEIVKAPGEDKIALNKFQALEPEMSTIIRRWQDEAKAKLLDLMKEDLKAEDVPEDVDPLLLAIVLFKCSGCNNVLEYPTVVGHDCLHHCPSYYAQAANEYDRAVQEVVRSERWDLRKLSCGALPKRVRLLVEACGKDPLRTTKQDMDGLDERFWCEAFSRDGTRHIMSWRTAVSWVPEITKADTEEIWQVAGPAERDKVDELEFNRRHAVLDKYHERSHWSCCLCAGYNASKRNITDIKAHLLKEHSIADPNIAHGDLYIDASSEARSPVPESVCLLSCTLALETLTRQEKQLLELGRAAYCKFNVQTIEHHSN